MSKERTYLTLKKVSDITGITIPDCFNDIMDLEIVDITQTMFDSKKVLGGGKKIRLYFAMGTGSDKLKQYIELAKDGIVVFSSVPLQDENGTLLPHILLNDYIEVRKAFYSLGKYIKQTIKLPTIGITGSVGKTTLTEFLCLMFAQSNKIFSIGNNLNGPGYITRELFRQYDNNYDYHIQEVGGGRIRGVEDSAEILDVDAFCISNILPHHLDNYKTIENILYDKTSFDRISDKEIFGVINADDKLLNEYPFKNKVVTCGIINSKADYIAKNIIQNGKYLEMDICNQDKTTHVQVKIVGKHNAYNVLLAFAMASEWGITENDIKDGLSKYRSDMIRQSLVEVSGRLLYIDCFNVSAESIHSCLATLEDMPIKKYNKRVAVIGGENALGTKSFSTNYEIGLNLGKYDVDEYIIIGIDKNAKTEDINWYGDSYALYRGIKRVVKNRPVTYYDNLEDAAEYIYKNTASGDLILFKGIYRLCFWAVIDMAFGTSFVVYNKYFAGKTISDDIYEASYYKQINGCNILKYKSLNKEIIIPNDINGIPVFRLGKSVLANRGNLEKVTFGYSIMNIGVSAFQNCRNLKIIENSDNVLHIEEYAFSGCVLMEKIILTSCEHIEHSAFAKCVNLSYLELGACCSTIEEGAFSECDKLVIYAPEGTYAIEFAKRNHIKYEILQ